LTSSPTLPATSRRLKKAREEALARAGEAGVTGLTTGTAGVAGTTGGAGGGGVPPPPPEELLLPPLLALQPFLEGVMVYVPADSGT